MMNKILAHSKTLQAQQGKTEFQRGFIKYQILRNIWDEVAGLLKYGGFDGDSGVSFKFLVRPLKAWLQDS